MTIPRFRIREGLLAEGAYALVAYGLAAGALLLILLLSQADAKPVTYGHGANSFTDLIALAATPGPALLALLGTGLLSHIWRSGAGAVRPTVEFRAPTCRSSSILRSISWKRSAISVSILRST
jgi:hypothetical protein